MPPTRPHAWQLSLAIGAMWGGCGLFGALARRSESAGDDFRVIYLWFEHRACWFLTYEDVKSRHGRPLSPCPDQLHCRDFSTWMDWQSPKPWAKTDPSSLKQFWPVNPERQVPLTSREQGWFNETLFSGIEKIVQSRQCLSQQCGNLSSIPRTHIKNTGNRGKKKTYNPSAKKVEIEGSLEAYTLTHKYAHTCIHKYTYNILF